MHSMMASPCCSACRSNRTGQLQPRWQVLERYTKQKQARAPALVEKLSGMVPAFRSGAQPASWQIGIYFIFQFLSRRRGDGAAERAGLENRSPGNWTASSNLAPSATVPVESIFRP
jgi:hypothetical protein